MHIFAAAFTAGFSLLSTSALAETWTKAEVKAVDAEQGKVTLKHEPITEMEMPAMTMVFRMVDPAKLEGLNEGDQIEFVAGNENGQLVVQDLKKN
jgi:Cu/Ag efflux protein CusF